LKRSAPRFAAFGSVCSQPCPWPSGQFWHLALAFLLGDTGNVRIAVGWSRDLPIDLGNDVCTPQQ